MSIKDKLDEDYAESWKPENEGDELVGKVVDFGARTTDYGRYTIITVKTAAGKALAFHAYHTVAANELSDAEPAIGDEIGIRYLGRKTGGEREYENYRIAVEHAPGWRPRHHATVAQEESIAAAQAAEEEERRQRDQEIPF